MFLCCVMFRYSIYNATIIAVRSFCCRENYEKLSLEEPNVCSHVQMRKFFRTQLMSSFHLLSNVSLMPDWSAFV